MHLERAARDAGKKKSMIHKRTKITDIAALAGVSIATVSRAIGNSGPVSPDARRRIEAALLATGYTPNNMARSLRRREARAIIVIVPNVGNPYFSAMLRGIEERAVAIGYSVLIGNGANDPEREAVYGRQVIAGRADGLILISGRLPYPVSGPGSRLPPIVLVSERIAGAALPLVSVDNVRRRERGRLSSSWLWSSPGRLHRRNIAQCAHQGSRGWIPQGSCFPRNRAGK